MSIDISLTGAQRLALIDLRQNATLSSRTQRRLSSGRKINSVIDDSVNYFKAKALSDIARDFDNLKAEMGQAIKHLEVTLEAISSLEQILGQIRGIFDASRSQSQNERVLANRAVENLGNQFVQLVRDASYGGSNLIDSTSKGRFIQLGTRSTSKLELPGLDFLKATDTQRKVFQNEGSTGSIISKVFNTGTGNFQYTHLLTAGGLTLLGANNSNTTFLRIATNRLQGAVESLRGHAQALGSNVAILQERERYTDAFVTLSTVGSEQYTLADLNEEGANLVALQTRQQLGIQALSVAGQQQRAILSLLQ